MATSLAPGGGTEVVYYRLVGDGADRLWGTTTTTFAGRPGRASVSLERQG